MIYAMKLEMNVCIGNAIMASTALLGCAEAWTTVEHRRLA